MFSLCSVNVSVLYSVHLIKEANTWRNQNKPNGRRR